MRKKHGIALGALCMAVLAAMTLGFYGLAEKIPVDPQEEILSPGSKERGGVIDIWLCETFQPGRGSFLRWINKSAEKYERQNKDVLINVKTISAESLALYFESGKGLPDAIICASGLIGSTDALAPAPDGNALGQFEEALRRDEALWGVPLAAGGYTILYSAQRLSEAGIDAAEQAPELSKLVQQGKKSVSYALGCAKSGYISYPLGLLGLLDVREEFLEYLPPDVFMAEAGAAWAEFALDGRYAAYVCTQKEVYRIRELGVFDWSVQQTPCRYSDQLLALYAFGEEATGKPDAQWRARTAQDFALFMQSQERQLALADIGAFSVTDAGQALYPAQSDMHWIEEGLMDDGLIMPNAFEWYDLRGRLGAADSSQEALALAKGLLDKSARMK